MSAMERTGEAAREALRREHAVRLVTADEEGFAAAHLPAGVYGFTGSPALESPLFAERRHRTFEIHHMPNGTIALVGFVSPAEASQLMRGPSDSAVALLVHPDVEGDASIIVSVPYDRIAHHRQYLVRPMAGIEIQVLPVGQPLSV
jgi:hypothetical protein